MQVIAIINYKGGVGKTTTAVNVAAAAYEDGKKVLLVDLDWQGSSSHHLRSEEAEKGCSDWLTNRATPTEAIQTVRNDPSKGQLDLCAGDMGLIAADTELQGSGSTKRLRANLKKLKGYDLVVLDCGPSPNFLNMNALFAAQVVLCPVELDPMAMRGPGELNRVLQMIRDEEDHDPLVLYVPTIADARVKKKMEQMTDALHEAFGKYPDGAVLPMIRYSNALTVAFAHAKTIFEHDPSNRAADDYRRLYHLLMEAKS